MPLKNINPIKTNSWKKLKIHFNDIKNISLKKIFKIDNKRFDNFSLSLNDDIFIDFSKNIINKKTINLLIKLAKECKLYDAIEKLFSGDIINYTENRPVLHTALRNFYSNSIFLKGKNIIPKIKKELKKIKLFSKSILNKKWKGYTGKPILNIINIGIGGSDLGPRMVVEALKYYKTNLNIYFISNIDSSHIFEILKKVDHDTSLFIISSKTFKTEETITNAITAREWFLKKAMLLKYINNHFIAISNNKKEIIKFGINSEKNIFKIWEWVGGRYSIWGSIGISICLAIGYKNFEKLLKGAYEVDKHFKNTSFEKNLPVILALIGIWYYNFFGAETHLISPYNQYLNLFPTYLQQVDMESNGKSIDRNGKKIKYKTGPIIWGGTGTNCQHSFYQLIHQSNKFIPSDFIISMNPSYIIGDHYEKILANFIAQTKALAFGKKFFYKKYLDYFKEFKGNKPSNSILIKKINPRILGSLIAIYEHKIFVQGIIWNIYSFDQWGVELGKKLAKLILYKIKKKYFSFSNEYDSSTKGIIKKIVKIKNKIK